MKLPFPYDVFLCHCSADKSIARELALRLVRDGLRVWFDEWAILPGDSIPGTIEKGLENSKSLVFLMSKSSLASDWVAIENQTVLFRDPMNKSRRFIPVLIEDVEIKPALRHFHYVDWRTKAEDQYTRLFVACQTGGESLPPATYSKVVYLVDDDPAAREAMSLLVQSKGISTRSFASAEDCLAAVSSDSNGCVVTDMRMPGMSGLDLLRQFRLRRISLPVIVITGFADVPNAVQAMRDGAATFLEKPCSDAELLHAIMRALSNQDRQTETVLKVRDAKQTLAGLSDDERLVLTKLVNGMPNKRIASELDIGLRTVELRRSSIMRKTGAQSLADLIRIVLAAEFVSLDGD